MRKQRLRSDKFVLGKVGGVATKVVHYVSPWALDAVMLGSSVRVRQLIGVHMTMATVTMTEHFLGWVVSIHPSRYQSDLDDI